jgi:hypothetical protein
LTRNPRAERDVEGISMDCRELWQCAKEREENLIQARDVGFGVRQLQLVIFGSPSAATPVIEAAPLVVGSAFAIQRSG